MKKTNFRYSYQTVGYGVFSLLGEIYRMGRIEVYDDQDNSSYACGEGEYCLPFEQAQQFEDFIENLESDYPIQIGLGSINECLIAVSEKLNIKKELLNDKDTKIKYFKKKAKS